MSHVYRRGLPSINGIVPPSRFCENFAGYRRMNTGESTAPAQRPHPRTIGWVGTSAMAMGGSNQSLFILAALFVGQGAIAGQGSAAVPLLVFGLLLSWLAAPGWLELVLMYPNRVGGIAATCAEAFKPYSPVLANLTGVCYWWGWIPTCGLTAIFSSAALVSWCNVDLPVPLVACGLVALFTVVNLAGVKWAARLAIVIATFSAGLAFISSFAPIAAGSVNWQQAFDFHLTLPFPGWFGAVTSAMAGLYLIGFAAPAFEAATCHVGETINPEKNVPRAMLASGLMAGVFFLILPIVWLGTLGSEALGQDLMHVLGPTFAPVFGSAAKAAAIWFMMFNMFHGTLQPLAGAARTLSQLADDGLLPEVFSKRDSRDAPIFTTLLTAGFAILFLLIGDPIWLVASANFTYLIGICLPNVAVWLLRRDEPEMRRPYRAPRGLINTGLIVAGVWGLSAILGFQQFGLPTVIIGLVFAYSGSALYAWRKFSDRRKAGLPGIARTLHIKLTGAMLLVLILDGVGYLIAVQSVGDHETAKLAVLEDIFVAVAMLTITVGLVLPGMIAHSAVEVSKAAKKLVEGTLADFTRAMQALGRGNLDAAHARVDFTPVPINSRDEVGEMAVSFNLLQAEIARSAEGLAGAREGLLRARDELTETNEKLEQRVNELAAALLERDRVEAQLRQAKDAAETADRAKSEFLAMMSHEVRTPLNGVLGFTSLLEGTHLDNSQRESLEFIRRSGESLLIIIDDILDLSRLEAGRLRIDAVPFELRKCVAGALETCRPPEGKPVRLESSIDTNISGWIIGDDTRLRQTLINLISNGVKFTPQGTVSLHVSKFHQPDGTEMLRFRIHDTGIGIPAEKLGELFKPFSQVDASSTRQYGGTGLGLAICRNLIRLMGGEISVESEPNRGSTFTFTLPAIASAEPAAGLPLSQNPGLPQKLRVLIAEDIEVNQTLTRKMLSEFGHITDVAGNGAECIGKLETQTYDLILMDLRMPVMDGFAATREIRRRERERGVSTPVYICALTANLMPRDREACQAAGMDDFLGKPLRVDEISDMLARFAGKQTIS
jgi:signal transduction histidine kinase/CheY-like chemotaxis protein/amino acid transporter